MSRYTKRIRKRKYSKNKKYVRRMKGGSESTLISGQALKNICKYNLDDRYQLKPIDSSLQEGDSVFLKFGDIPAFVASPPSKKVTLVVGNMDDTFGDEQITMVSPHVTKVYSINCSAKGAIQIPIGFRDDQYTPHKVMTDILNDSSKSGTKNILCLVNFLIGTNGSERSKARDQFNGKPWATISEGYMNYNTAKSLNHSDPETKKIRTDYYTMLKRTKCVACPPGTGVDTHRVYETLYFGAIPIIKSSFLDPMYERLGGCWIVNDWSEVTEEECNRRWENRSSVKVPFEASDWFPGTMSGGSKRNKRKKRTNKKKLLYGGKTNESRTEVSCKYISPMGIIKSCNIHFIPDDVNNPKSWEECNDFDKYMNIKDMKNGSVIFIKFECLKKFIKKLESIPYNIIIVTGGGDHTFPTDIFSDEEFDEMIKNDKIIHMFSINCVKKHDKLTPFPIGIDYHELSRKSTSWGEMMSPKDQEKELEEVQSNLVKFQDRTIKCYSNFHFSIQEDRKYTKDRRDAKAQIGTECMFYEPTKISRKDTWKNQSKYAFVVCPHGNGLDCHRQWEALCLGCIPVVKTSEIDLLYEDLPVLIVNEWYDINQDLLNNTIEKFSSKTFKYDKLLLKYWTDRINNYSKF